MKRPARIGKEQVSGALIVAIGVLATSLGYTYRPGTLLQMGAGFLPMVFGVLMVAVGLALALTDNAPSAVEAEVKAPEEPESGSPWRG